MALVAFIGLTAAGAALTLVCRSLPERYQDRFLDGLGFASLLVAGFLAWHVLPAGQTNEPAPHHQASYRLTF